MRPRGDPVGARQPVGDFLFVAPGGPHDGEQPSGLGFADVGAAVRVRRWWRRIGEIGAPVWQRRLLFALFALLAPCGVAVVVDTLNSERQEVARGVAFAVGDR